MKNFPSTLIKQESTRDSLLGDNIKTTLKNIGNKIISNIFGSSSGEADAAEMANGFADGLDRRWLELQLEEVDILSSAIQNEPPINSVGLWANSNRGKSSNKVRFEDPFVFSNDFFETINNYRYVFNFTNKSIVDHGLDPGEGGAEGKETFAIMETAIAPSLFNPFNSVIVTGMTENIPLVNENSGDTNKEGSSDSVTVQIGDMPGYTDAEKDDNGGLKETYKVQLNTNLSEQNDVSDCSIRTLVKLSNKYKSELGVATYRYIDFMYCKDLGKIPNNRLITLRKFSGPIGDNIFKDANIHWAASDEKAKNKFYYSQPDIGRLITWFDNDDNKLEDICKYSYRASWKEFTANIDEKSSEQKDNGLLDQLSNLFSPQNNQLKAAGYIGNTKLLSWAAQKMHIPLFNGGEMKDGYGWETLRNYDQHRIYEPPNRIWETHKYEGRLTFNQDINLTFRYKLRSYDNINPKSAFLDLLGNILVVTYRRGSFWGGENKIYGAQGNNSVYATGHAIIDKAFDKLGGIWHAFKNGAEALDMITGWMSNAAQLLSDMKEKSAEMIQDPNAAKNMANQASTYVEKKNKEYKWTDAIKGMVKDQLGRPAMYAFNSLLTGENVGPWHLTIGNPRNPIMSIGNLILIDSQVWHSGPLGLDDFPTELNVKVTLKHAKSRDAVDIQKMYTKGRGSIYSPMNLMQMHEFRDQINTYAFGDLMQYKGEGKVLKKLLSSV